MPAPKPRIFDSPCKSICRIDERFGWCTGCKRTRAEIKAWSTASPAEKEEILNKLPDRSAAEVKMFAAPIAVTKP